MNAAPPSENCKTSVKKAHRRDHEPNPTAENVPDAPIDSGKDGLKYEHCHKPKRPTRRDEALDIPERCQTGLSLAAAWQLIATNVSERPNKKVMDGSKDAITKTSQWGTREV